MWSGLIKKTISLVKNHSHAKKKLTYLFGNGIMNLIRDVSEIGADETAGGNMNKRVLSVLLTAGLLCSSVTGCNQENNQKEETSSQAVTDESQEAETGSEAATEESQEEAAAQALEMEQVNDQQLNIIDDNYRTCYEVFVYSFYDSDGDGIGDLNGLTQKLDYINDGDDTTDTDLGCNEIWLMPIMPSTTYHKYDVIDYCDIDPEYGTMDDFKVFLEECHNRGINVIIDFVMNHTSSQHEWFTTACEYLRSLEPGQEPDATVCPYVEYYNFVNGPKGNYYQVSGTDWYYEAPFWSEMPDLNLSNEAVRQEYTDIVQFWLDLGVDGFRLDAVKEYYNENVTANVEALTWFTDMVKSKKEDAYLVGEAWTDYNTYTKYYASGMDSLFDFAFANSDGYIAKTLNGMTKSGASTYGKAIEAVDELIAGYSDSYINAPFYTNHDLARGAGYYNGDYAENKVKMAQAMNLLMSGNAFLYYGEELGMKGAGKDENKRVAMYWSDDADMEGMCDGPKDADEVKMTYDSLEAQQEDPTSIYRFVKQVIKLRNIYPEIARGTMTFEEALSNDQVCVFTKEYEGSQLMIVFNISENENTVDLSGVSLNGKDAGDLEAAGMLQTTEEAVTVEGSVVTLPAYSVELLK